jgi:formate dehydrogenase subunit gamma
MPAYERWSAERALSIINDHSGLQGATLPIFHALQATFGYVDKEAVPLVADALNLSRAEIYGCLTFYHDFRAEPAGRHVVKLCRAEACQAVGADSIHDEIRRRLGVDWHGTTADGNVTVEPVFCLGLCSCGPAALINDEPVARLNADALQARLAEHRQ